VLKLDRDEEGRDAIDPWVLGEHVHHPIGVGGGGAGQVGDRRRVDHRAERVDDLGVGLLARQVGLDHSRLSAVRLAYFDPADRKVLTSECGLGSMLRLESCLFAGTPVRD
jgi:hypothetical protein